MPTIAESPESGAPPLSSATSLADLRRLVTERYAVPSIPRAVWQLAATSVALVVVWWLSLKSLEITPWLTLVLAVPAAGLLVRLFIFQHDCGHGSFFASQRVNDIVGSCLGVVTLTPYYYWRRTHALHHAGSGNLAKRGVGDITTLTIREYEELSPGAKLRYRLYRNPLVLMFAGALIHFLFFHRWPSNMSRSSRERWGVVFTNVGLAVIIGGLCWMVGIQNFLLVQGPITLVTCAAGVWLFYVQHQFEDAYWADEHNWEFERAGLAGSSYYRLPRVVQWFTGNIGLHHVHHLSSRIPNYRLERAHKEIPLLQEAPTLTFFQSLRCAFLKLYDEESRRLVSFREARRLAVAAS